MFRILVDADACPVVAIVEKIAKREQIPCTLLCDTNHVMHSDYSEVLTIGAGADAVDFALINHCHRGDIVVSQDYGVAAMALGKGAYAIHQSGKWYTNENIDSMLMERHMAKKERMKKSKHHMKGPAKRTREDDQHFEDSFVRLVTKAKGTSQYELREIHADEIEQAIAIEQICFPPNEACSPQSMRERIQAASECFLVAEDHNSGEIVGFLNGIATDETVFRDEFFTDISLHQVDGKNIMILGLDVIPEHRMKGLARKLVSQYVKREQQRSRSHLYLTCLDNKVEMYQKMGFRDLGLSNSSWGGEEWHEMVYDLASERE